MKPLIKQKLQELSIPDNVFRVTKQIDLAPDEKLAIQNVRSEDLVIDDLGGNNNVAHLRVVFPFETKASDSIVVDIEIINGGIYQIHMHMPETLQGLGLGYKIYKALIFDYGHLYSGKGRVMNPIIKYIWGKLEKTSGIECIKSAIGELCVSQSNPHKEELKAFMN